MATTRVFYKGKKELTMAQFEALTELDNAVDYDITDFPNGGITNAQMTTALGYSRLFGDGDVFVCSDDGTYTKGHTYKVKVTDGVKSWEDITPESTPSTGTNIQVTELPPASAENVGKIVQFITEKEEGEEPVQGHWYKCKPVVADEGRYEWVKQLVQDKDYIINTSNVYSPNLENVGRMVYQGSGRQIYWLPNIALGELAQLVSYQGNITINYTINDDYYPDGITKSQEMTWNTDMNGWMAIDASGFYSIAKQAKMFGSETLTKPLYMAVYQGEDLTITARKTTKITVTSITLANGTAITIPTGYGEAKFYNYSINAGYSSPIDFYSKFESGNLTDADIEAFRFMTVNQVDATFDINHLMVETEGGLAPLKDYLSGSPFKNSTFESTENGSSKEDTWKTTDPDTTLSMQHQNDNGQSGYSVSKNYTEMSSTLTTNGAITSTKLAVTNDTATMKSEDGAGNSKQFKMTPTEMLFSERPKVKTNGETSEDVAIKGDLQNYVPTQSELSPVALTWRFNDVVNVNRDAFTVNFTSNGINFTEIGFKMSMSSVKDTMYYSGPTKFQDVYYGQWSGDTVIYRTVTFETAPSGELLTWLQANAVPQVDPNTALTWTINNPWGSDDEMPSFGRIPINFTSNDKKFTSFVFEAGVGYTLEGEDLALWILQNWTSNGGYPPLGVSNGDDLSMYRTVTFETAPTGTLLEWLKTHAVPQGSSAKTYAQVTNENGAVSIRVFENGDADLQNLSITKDGVTINGKKPLTSIQPLYKHELVIPYSFSVTDPANGTATVNGSVMYHYLSNSGTQITSASAIDDNFMLSGGIGKNSANTVLLFDVNVTKAGSSITVEAVNASTMGYITGTVGTITDTVTQLI